MNLLKSTFQIDFLFKENPYLFNYQVPRSLIAIAQLITLTLTNPKYNFYNSHTRLYQQDLLPNIFSYDFGLVLSILILFWVISGLLPQVSSFFHFWVSFSFLYGALIVEGGDQVAQILTLLLIPICVFDKRINLWRDKEFFTYKSHPFIKYLTASFFSVIQLQVAVIYLFAAAVKVNVEQWIDGSAMYYWLHHTMGPPKSITTLFSFIINNHYLSPILTWSVVIFEFLLFGALFMNKKNKQKLIMPALIFHFLIAICFGLWSFSLIMIGACLFLLNPYFLSLKNSES